MSRKGAFRQNEDTAHHSYPHRFAMESANSCENKVIGTFIFKDNIYSQSNIHIMKNKSYHIFFRILHIFLFNHFFFHFIQRSSSLTPSLGFNQKPRKLQSTEQQLTKEKKI